MQACCENEQSSDTPPSHVAHHIVYQHAENMRERRPIQGQWQQRTSKTVGVVASYRNACDKLMLLQPSLRNTQDHTPLLIIPYRMPLLAAHAFTCKITPCIWHRLCSSSIHVNLIWKCDPRKERMEQNMPPHVLPSGHCLTQYVRFTYSNINVWLVLFSVRICDLLWWPMITAGTWVFWLRWVHESNNKLAP